MPGPSLSIAQFESLRSLSRDSSGLRMGCLDVIAYVFGSRRFFRVVAAFSSSSGAARAYFVFQTPQKLELASIIVPCRGESRSDSRDLGHFDLLRGLSRSVGENGRSSILFVVLSLVCAVEAGQNFVLWEASAGLQSSRKEISVRITCDSARIDPGLLTPTSTSG